MRHAFILSLGLFMASPAPAAAECIAAQDPAVTVTVRERPIEQDQAFSRHALAERVGGVSPGWQAFGLTEVSHATEIHYGFQILQAGRKYCATLASVTVTITLRLTVHLASELKRGSCAYQAVDEHEQQHVDLERQSMPIARDRVEAAIAGVARRGVTSNTIDSSTGRLDEATSRVIKRALDAFAAEKNRRHAAFDTREEYTKLSHRCSDGEIRALLNQ